MKIDLKKNKALLILPVALLPFVILIFYILGGGEEQQQKELAQERAEKQGANYILPEAEKSIVIYDKMEAYQKQNLAIPMGKNSPLEDADSLLVKQTNKGENTESDSLVALYEKGANEDVSSQLMAHIRKKEAAVRNDLEEEPLEKEHSPKRIIKQQGARPAKTRAVGSKKEIYLEKQIQMQENGLEDLEQVFEENSSLNQQNDSLQFYLEQTQNELSLLKEKRQRSFSLEKKNDFGFNGSKVSKALIKAEVYESTTVLDGNRIKMRLLEDAWIDGKKAPRNTFLYGTCKIQNERLNIQVSYFPMEGSFLPVDLQIHDLDGLPGLYIPDNVARRVSKEVGSRSNTSSVWGMSSDPLANMGISAVDRTSQSLLKRVRIRKVHIKKNSLVYLINKK